MVIQASPNNPGSSKFGPFDKKMSRAMGRCTGSNPNFKLARQWIKSCQETHRKCERGKIRTCIRPARLVYVGTDSEDPHLHLVDSTLPVPEYLTLSHCWGGRSPLVLKSASLVDFKSRIPFSTLSKTFQEAVHAVRRLGYSYIWIDSLCIIQDSTEDWERESEIMGDIYRASVLTIAATASRNGDEGCFRIRNTLAQRPCLLWEGEESCILVDLEDALVAERYRREVNNGPLNTRAWVLQERVLSARVLHYAATSVYWDCQEAHLSDSGRDCELSEHREGSTWGSYDEDLRMFGEINWNVEENFSDRWKFNVERYCEMKLTVESDRHVAFLGIIKYVEEATGLQCIFGLWKEHLLAHLLWRIEKSSKSVSVKSINQKPSWSWVSVAGRVRYFPPQNSQSFTFWHPEDEKGWPKKVLDVRDPDTIDSGRNVRAVGKSRPDKRIFCERDLLFQIHHRQ